MWSFDVIESPAENYIGIPDKLLDECVSLLESPRGRNRPLTFRIKYGSNVALVGMTEFVPGDFIHLPGHIISLLSVQCGNKVQLNVIRSASPVLKTLFLKPLTTSFYEQTDHVRHIEENLRFFPTMNLKAVLPIRFSSDHGPMVPMKVERMIDPQGMDIPIAVIRPEEEVQLEFVPNEELHQEYMEAQERVKRDNKMAFWNRVWEAVQSGRPVFGMTDELRKYINNKRILSGHTYIV